MRYETTTKLEPSEALTQAEQFFGSGGYGLTVNVRTAREIGFEGTGGHVLVTVLRENPTTLDLETREWDAAVQSFLGQLPR